MTRSSSPAHDRAREFPGMIGCFRAAPNSGPTSKSLPGPQFSFGLDLLTFYRRVWWFRGSGNFVHAFISICVSACAIISMCIRVLVNNYKERLEQMQFVKMSQLIRQNSQLNKTNIKMYLFITYFNMVDFSAIKIAIF